MILRKPYAFLIKYFKIIHVLMFIFFTYLIFAIRPIYLFSANYLTNNNMYFDNITSRYVPFILFVIVILILAFGVGIYFLMRKKEKPVLFYKLVIVYSVVLFIILVYFYIFFSSLSKTNYSNLQIVINRDIIMVIYYINYLFVGFSFVRATGFDIKKFSFDKDRRELQLEENDSEEYEVGVRIEKEDILDFLNRQKREFKYYFMENSLFFTIVSGAGFVFLCLYFGYSIFVTNRIYKQNSDVNIGGVTYNINKSIITTRDKYGKVLGTDNDFLVVGINISNNNGKITLDSQQFRVNVSDEYYYPLIGYCDSFNDFGTCYRDANLGANSKYNYIMVFKIGKSHSKIYFEILKNKNSYDYSKVKLKYETDTSETVEYNKGDTFKINNEDYQVNNYQIVNKTTYTYENCVEEKCTNYVKVVSPKLGNQVLQIEITNLDKLKDDFLDNSIGLKYRNKVLYGSDIDVISRYNNMLYLDIPSSVREDDRLVFTINARNKEYDILLRDGANE